MAQGSATIFDISELDRTFKSALQHASQLDSRLESMVKNSAELQKNMTGAFKGSLGDILSRMQGEMSKIGNVNLTPDVDTQPIEKLVGKMSEVVEQMKTIGALSGKRGVELFDTENIYTSTKVVAELQKDYDKLIENIKAKESELLGINRETFLNTAEGKKAAAKYKSGANTVHFQNELERFKQKPRAELSVLQEEKRILKDRLKWAKMTYAERLSYLQKILGKELSEEQKHINSIKTEYRQLSQEIIDITKQRANLTSQNKGGRLNSDIQILDDQLQERNERRLALETQYSDQLVDLIEKNQRKVIDLKAKNLKAEDSLVQQQIERRRSTPQGALDFASSAQTQGDMEQALKYLDVARKNVNVSTQEGIELNAKLIKKYSELKTAIEELEGKTKDQNTLVATESAKYARLLRDINKYQKALEDLRKSEDYQNGDADAHAAEQALLAEIQVLEDRKKLYAQNAESIKQAETLVAAETAKEKTAIILREEQKRNELAKQEEQKRLELAKKYAGMSPKEAETQISQNGVAAIEEESKAIKDLIEQKYDLSAADKDYVAKINDLDKAISIHKDNLDKLNAALKEQEKEKQRQAQTASGALRYAKEAKTVAQLQQAYKNLEIASKNVNVTTASGASTFNKLSQAMGEVREKLQKYKVELNGVSEKHTNLLNTGSQLKRALTSLFSVSAIKSYIKHLIDLRGEFELQQRSLQAIIGDTQMANRLWEQTTQLAIRSPYRVKELVTYTKQLAAYRIESEKLYDTTKRLADIASGVGIDMQRLILAYGQVRAANYLRGTELRQFSEAGINILGKLADRFTELEGRAVSVGDVFERVSKRMVSFEEVDAVLKQMTDVGGEFYNMQEIQAETLGGMWSNLQDQIDLMLNEIGKSNEGILKGSISLFADLVKNWRALADAIDSVATSLGVATLAYIAFNNAALQGGIMKATKEVSKGVKIKDLVVQGNALDKVVIKFGARFAKFAQTLKGILSTLGKLNPAIKGIALAFGAFNLIKKWNNYLKESNKAFDDIIDRSIESTGELVKYNLQIEKNNKIIKENIRIKEDSSKTDEERAAAETKLNEAQRENIAIANKIQSTYSSVADEFKVSKDGIIDFANAFKIANIELATSTALADKMKAKWAGIDDSLSQSYSDFTDELKNITEKSNAYDKTSTLFLGSIGQKYGVGVQRAAAYAVEQARKYAEQGATIDALGLFNSLQTKAGLTAEEILDITDAIRAYSNAVAYSKNEQRDFVEDIAEGRDDIKAVYQSYLTLGLTAEQAQKRLKNYINTWLTEMGVVDERARDIAQETIMLGFDFEIDFNDKDVNNEVKKRYKKVAKEIIGARQKEAQKGGVTMEFVYSASGIEETEDFVGAIDAVVKGYQETDNKIKKLKDSSGKYNEEELKQLNLRLETLKAIAREYGILHLLDIKGDKDATNLNKKRISLIREMRSSYVKANKYDSTPDLSSFKGAFDELFAGTGIKFSDIIVSTSGDVAATLKKLRPLVEKVGGESGKALMVEFEKAVGEYSTESTVEGFENYLKGVKTSMDNLLEDYRAGLELAEMGFTNKDIEDLFGVETVSLETMKAVLAKMGETLNTMGTEGEKIFQDYSNKIADIEDKEQQERLKTYSKYLLKGQSERLKIEKDTLRQIREVNKLKASGAYFDTEANDIIKGIEAERDKKIAKLGWDEFKGSKVYVQMFEDLESKSYSVLTAIKGRLIEIREEMQSNAENIDPSDMKEIVTAIERVDNIISNKNPFAGFGNSLKDWWNLSKQRAEFESAYADALQKSQDAKTRETQTTVALAAAEERLNAAKEGAIASPEMVAATTNLAVAKAGGDANEIAIAQEQYDIAYDTFVLGNAQVKLAQTEYRKAQTASEAAKNGVEDANKGLTDATENMNNLDNATKRSINGFRGIAQVCNSIGGLISDIGSNDDLFGTKEAQNGFIALGDTITLVGSTISGVMDAINASNPIGWIVLTLKTLVSIVQLVAKTRQAKTDALIDTQYEKIEKLQKESEQLEKSIEEAYDIQQLKRYNEELQRNLEEQKKAAAEAKAAAEDGKNNEKNQQAAEEAQEKYDELLEESAEKAKELFSEMTAGIFDDSISAAEGFIDAWLEAYQEVGDGMSGLTDLMEEQMMDVLKRQAAYAVVGQYVNRWKSLLESQINTEDPIWSDEEQKEFWKTFEGDAEAINAALKSMKLVLGDGKELSGIQKGIQGITADQADVLAAYWNSVRFLTASIDQKFDIPLSRFFSDDVTFNPMLNQLRQIAGNTAEIRDLLSSVIDLNGGKKALRMK